MTGELLAERTALRVLFEHAQYLKELVELYAIEDHASSRPIDTAFLEEVAASDLIIFLLGTELRDAVVKEFDQAEKYHKRILCYIDGGQQPTPALKTFIAERAYKHHVARFGDDNDLLRRIRRDLVGEFVRGFRGTVQGIALKDGSESYLIREIRAPYASNAFFTPAEVHELLDKPEYVHLDADQLLALAMLHLEESGNYLGALLLVEGAILRSPKNWMALSNRGMLLNEMGLKQHAQLSYEAAAAHNPESATIQFNLGNCHYETRDYQRALHHYHKALQIEPDKPSAVSRIVATYLQLEDAGAAIEWATRSLKLDPSEISIANMALALGLDGRRADAIHYADQLKGDPARVHELKAFIEYKNGNYEACVDEVDAYAALAPTSIRAASLKYESLIALERACAAESYFKDLESRHLLMASDYNSCGYQHMTAFGPSKFSTGLFREAVSLDPSCMPCWHNLQSCLGELDELEETLAACDEALELAPLDQKSIQNKAITLQQLGRFSELANLMASKAAGLLGPITGDTPEDFVQQILTSPMRQQLKMLDELAQKLLKPEPERGDSSIQDDSDT